MSPTVAFFSNARGVLPALTEALALLRKKGVQDAYCLGNLVGEGPLPNETVALARKHRLTVLLGPFEAAIAGRSPPPRLFPTREAEEAFHAAVQRILDELDSTHLRYLQNLPDERRFGAAGLQVLATAGRVGTPWKQLPPDAPQGAVLQEVEGAKADLVVLGTDGAPFVREAGGRRVVATGPLHDPRHHEGRLTLLDTATGEVRQLVVPYVPE